MPLFGASLTRGDSGRYAAIAGGSPGSESRRQRSRRSIVIDTATGERRVGRFDGSAQVATLLDISGDAYRNEMGITERHLPAEFAFGIPAEQLKHCDAAADPEDKLDPVTRLRDIDHFAAFMRFLAPDRARSHRQRGPGRRAHALPLPAAPPATFRR